VDVLPRRRGEPLFSIGWLLRRTLLLAALLLPIAAAPAIAQSAYTADTRLQTRYAAVHGRMGLLGGNATAGLEGWAYPLQIFRGLRPYFRLAGTSSSIDSAPLLRHIAYTPTTVERTYVGADFTVRETLFVPHNLPGAILTYTVDSKQPIQIEIRFVPVLDLMWPVATGGQEIHWLPDTNAYLLDEPTQRFHALFGSPDAVLHDDLVNTNMPLTSEHVLRMTLRAAKTVHVFMAADTHGAKETRELYQRLISNSATLESDAAQEQQQRVDAAMRIETPDADVNRALAWSQLALDQAWVCNPTLGCGLVAGYGPSRGLARRPQYAWFFAGDALTTMHTLLLAGEFARTREALLFLMRYQDPQSGMMWHEMSQSATYVNWVRDYPYMFPHVDITFQFLSTLGDYANATGDSQFLKDHWSKIESAYKYCSSLIDPADGLPKVPAGKEGSDEQEHPREELSLAVAWVQASEAFADLAELTGHADLAEKARAASLRAGKVIPAHFWNQQRKFWSSGILKDGEPEEAMHLPPAASFSLLDASQQKEVLDRVASPEFETAWGTRGVGSASKSFDPSSYATGSVWATSTATAALELWHGDRPDAAWKVWSTLLPWLKLDAMGHIHETLSGSSFRPQIESVPEQTWSSAMFVSSFLQGVLGEQLDAEHHRLTLEPNLPPEWRDLSVQRLRIGETTMDVALHRSDGRIELQVRSEGAPVELTFIPVLPAGARVTLAQMDQHRIMGTTQSPEERVNIPVRIMPDGTTHTISIAYRTTR
jgi:glycogen debranching enzyme